MKKISINNRSLFQSIIPILCCSVALFLGACGSSTTGSGGMDNNGNGENGGSPIGTEPTFATVQEIFNQSCGGSSCHIGERTNGVRLDSYENVINSEGNTYGKKVVQAGDADGSPLVDKIELNPEIGSRMPQTGNFLSQERIDQIRQWINDGAKNN